MVLWAPPKCIKCMQSWQKSSRASTISVSCYRTAPFLSPFPGVPEGCTYYIMCCEIYTIVALHSRYEHDGPILHLCGIIMNQLCKKGCGILVLNLKHLIHDAQTLQICSRWMQSGCVWVLKILWGTLVLRETLRTIAQYVSLCDIDVVQCSYRQLYWIKLSPPVLKVNTSSHMNELLM